jgi:hypothetical protein
MASAKGSVQVDAGSLGSMFASLLVDIKVPNFYWQLNMFL